MQIRLSCGFQYVVKRLPWCGKMGIDTRNTSVSDLLEKLEHFLRLVALNMLIYVNLC